MTLETEMLNNQILNNNSSLSTRHMEKTKRNIQLSLIIPEDLSNQNDENSTTSKKKMIVSIPCSTISTKSPSIFKSKVQLSPSLFETPKSKYLSIDELISTNELIRTINNHIKKSPHSSLNSYVSQRYHDEEDTAVMSLQYCQLANHIKSLHIEQIQKLLRPILIKLYTNQRNNGLFNSPVDVVALNLHDYHKKISKPMDLGTMKNRLSSGFYESLESAVSDIKQVFINAMSYNPPNHSIHILASEMLNEFIVEMKALEDKKFKEYERKESHNCSLCMGSQCHLCGEKCLKFEPPALGCQTCAQKIKRNSIYFISPDGLYTWCQKCQVTLPTIIECTNISKRHLLKRKLDEEVAEPWVSCDKCGRWVHQVCAIYSSGFSSHNSCLINIPRFECPTCKIESIENLKKISSMKPIRIVSTDSCSGNSSFPLTPIRNPFKRIRERNNWSNGRIIRKIGSIDSTRSLDNISPNTTISGSSVPFFTTNFDMIEDLSKDDNSYHMLISNQLNGSSDTSSSHNDCDFASDSLSENDMYTDDLTDSLVSQTIDTLETTDTNPSIPLKRTFSTYVNHRHQESSSKPMPSFCNQWRASSLPRTKLSDFLECLVSQCLQKTGYSNVIDSVTIRMVSNSEHEFETPVPILNNLTVTTDGVKYFKPPIRLSYRHKCILLFQNIDGVDVCLFCLYVQEFDNKCPPPNNSVAYIAYLDSVDYFRPANARTMVYHEVMTGYMKWIQMRGFQRCHIWSCPPQRGDNFIFWCHPSHQKTPSRERLNAWYSKMLQRCKRLGIVESISNLYDCYFEEANKIDRFESTQRKAAKNSFVGSGKASAARYCSMKKAQNAIESFNLISAPAESNLHTIEPSFTCPPIFEGDHWVQDFLRCYRSAINRMNYGSSESKDILANQRRARDMLKDLMSRNIAVAFNQPVDYVALNLPTYKDVIPEPMDLGTIRQRLRSQFYPNFLSLAKDVRLTFFNAMTFNPKGHHIHTAAATLLKSYNTSLKTMVTDCTLESFDTEDDPKIDDYLSQFKLQSMTSIDNIKIDCGDDSSFDPVTPSCLKSLSSVSFDCKDPSSVSNLHKDEEELNFRAHRSDSVVSIASMCSSKTSNVSTFPAPISISSPPLTRDKENSSDYLLTSFECPELGLKRLNAVITDLRKGIHRLKDDLFVVIFKSPIQTSLDEPNVKRSKVDLFTTDRSIEKDCIDVLESVISSVTENDIRTNTMETLITHPAIPKPGRPKTRCVNFNLGRPPTGLTDKFLSDEIPAVCLELLSDINPDTSDPDPLRFSSFVGFRHTFLEMCQFRHYQFDSLRRAKHSSLMLLYHLHHPNDPNTRPTCAICFEIITMTRYHCDQCACYELCTSCYEKTQSSSTAIHEHLLTPYRVTYI